MDEIYIKNRKNLISVAKHMGLLSGCSQEFLDKYCKNGYEGENVIMEALARLAMEAAMKRENPDVEVRQMPLDCAYDIEVQSGSTLMKIEGKVRSFSSTKYPTLNISLGKGATLEKRGAWFLFVLCLGDWKWHLWNMSDYVPKKGVWTHKKYTANNRKNWKTTEECLMFEKDAAEHKGCLKRNGEG